MKNKILLTLLLIKLTLTGFSTVWPVSNMGNTFSSATITINFGDTVNFQISGSHDAREVSLMTWNANGNTALFGGFQTNFGGGMVYPNQLGIGSHYYVCTPHASMGMKGIIIVQNCSAPISPNSIIGNANVCSATSNTYSVTPVLGATSYSWILPGSWTGTSSTNSITTTVGISSGNISVSAINSCGSSAPQILTVNVNTVNTSVSQSGNMLSANISGATYQWINCLNNTIILGQISQTFNAPAIGNYAVIITQNGCSDTSSCYNISTVEISENSFSIFTKIYPNPSTGNIQIIIDDLKFIKNSSIEIFNLQGVIIYQSEIINTKFDIDLINQTKGFYFVKISAGEKFFARKILIE